MHAGTHSNVSGDSSEQHVAAASGLGDSRDTLILGMQPSQRRSNKPFTGHVLRFIGPVRQPEARFDFTAEPCCLGSLRADKGMKILISNKTLQTEEPGVGPI